MRATRYEPRDRLEDLSAVVAFMAAGYVLSVGLGLADLTAMILIAALAAIGIFKRL